MSGKVELKKIVHDGVTVGSSSTEILPANDRRLYAEIVNTSNEGIWIKLGEAAVSGEGIYIAPSGFSYEIKHGENLWRGAVYGICASGGKAVGTIEGQ